MIPGLCSLLYRRGGGSSGGLTVVTTPSSITTTGRGTVTSGSITAVPSGGVAPYTYSWTQSGDPGATILTPTAMSTQMRYSLASGDLVQIQLFCTVTDAASNIAMSGGSVVSFRYV